MDHGHCSRRRRPFYRVAAPKRSLTECGVADVLGPPYRRERDHPDLNGAGFKANYYKGGTGEEFWMYGPKRNSSDRLYGERVPVEIDEDIRTEYGTQVRGQPEGGQEAIANP